MLKPFFFRLLPHIWIVGLLVFSAPVSALDIKIATVAPDGTLWMKEMRKAAEEISRRTDARAVFKFYPGGSMGNNRSVLRKIRAGQLHGGMLSGGALSEIYQDAEVYGLPFQFRSYEEVDYVRARMDKKIAQGIEDRGFVTFGFADGGFAYIMSSVPVRGAEDLKNQKVWMPEDDNIARAMFGTLGVSPVPLPLTDVLTGLQTGLITTVGASAVGAIALQWHTKVKFVTDSPILYLYGALAVDKKTYARLSRDDQAVVREVMERSFATLNLQTRLDDRNARAALRKQGIEFLAFTPEELNKLHRAADQTIDRLSREGTINTAAVNSFRDELVAYRRRAGTTSH